VLEVKIFGASREPSGSVARRPVDPAFALKLEPAVLKPIAACPCPETTMEGIQYQRADATEAVESKIVPD